MRNGCPSLDIHSSLAPRFSSAGLLALAYDHTEHCHQSPHSSYRVGAARAARHVSTKENARTVRLAGGWCGRASKHRPSVLLLAQKHQSRCRHPDALVNGGDAGSSKGTAFRNPTSRQAGFQDGRSRSDSNTRPLLPKQTTQTGAPHFRAFWRAIEHHNLALFR